MAAFPGLVPTDVEVEGDSWKRSSMDVAIAGGERWQGFRAGGWDGGRTPQQVPARHSHVLCFAQAEAQRAASLSWPRRAPSYGRRPGLGGRGRGGHRRAARVGAPRCGHHHSRHPGPRLCSGPGAAGLWPRPHRRRQEQVGGGAAGRGEARGHERAPVLRALPWAMLPRRNAGLSPLTRSGFLAALWALPLPLQARGGGEGVQGVQAAGSQAAEAAGAGGEEAGRPRGSRGSQRVASWAAAARYSCVN